MVGGAGCDEMEAVVGASSSSSSDGGGGGDGGGDAHSTGVAAMHYAAAGPPGSTNISSYRYATGVLEANHTALYWRAIDSIDGSLIDEVFLTR